MSKKKIRLELKARKRERAIEVACVGGNPILVNQAPFKTYTDKGAQMVTKNTYQKVFGKKTTLGEELLIRAKRVWTPSEAKWQLKDMPKATSYTYSVLEEKAPNYSRQLRHEIVNAMPQDREMVRVPQGVIVLKGAERTKIKPKSLSTARVIRLRKTRNYEVV